MNFATSKAVVIEKPRCARLREIELTDVTDESIVCRTTMSAISSGTDMKTWRGEQHPEKLYYPCVPGYENVGEVVWVGPKADTSFAVGDRVMINECRVFGNVCGAWGGSSGYVVKNRLTAPGLSDNLVKIPDKVADSDAVIAYLGAVALKGLRRFNLSPSDTLVVNGAGAIGIGAMQIVKILCPGITVVAIDRNAFRRSIAEKFADAVFPDTEAVAMLAEFTHGKMADKVMECSGNPQVVGQLYRFIKDGGWSQEDAPAHIHLQGDYPEPIIIDGYHRWFVKNCTITMTCALQPGCKEQVMQWVSEGKYSTAQIPVEIFPVQKCDEAYRYVDTKGADIFKVLFDWKGAL